MSEYLLLGAGWLLLSLPASVFLGKCISVGQAGETARHAAAAAPAEPTAAALPSGATGAQASSGAALPALPGQRQPVVKTPSVR